MSPLPVDTGTAGEHCTNTTLPPEHVGIPCQVSSGGRDHQFSPRAHLPNQFLACRLKRYQPCTRKSSVHKALVQPYVVPGVTSRCIIWTYLAWALLC